MIRLTLGWIGLSSGLWFVPTMIVLALLGLAVALTELDRHVDPQVRRAWPALMTSDAGSAREMLSSISNSIITVAGVVFSITIVTLTLASTQYSSRTVRAFTRDKVSQAVLGTMAGTYAYCSAVLLTISGGEGAFVPSLAVFAGFLLAIAGLFALIFFIHHVTTTIQASSIIASIAKDTDEAIRQTFRGQHIEDGRAAERRTADEANGSDRWTQAPSRKTGYILRVDIDALVRFALQHEVTVRMDHSAGDFVISGKPLVSISPARELEQREVKLLNRAHMIGRFRTVDQDPDFGIRQLVDIALKALSPGVNDTTTAVLCVDHLTSVLVTAATRPEGDNRYHEGGRVAVLVRGPTFAGLVAKAFDQIRQNASGNIAVITALANGLGTLGSTVTDNGRREPLVRQAEAIAELIERTVQSPQDRREVRAHLDRATRDNHLERGSDKK